MKIFYYFFILLVLLASGFSNAQNFSKVNDTLNVVTFQRFKIPKDKNWVIQNVLDLKVSAKLYSKDGQFIRDLNDIWRELSEEQLKKEVTGGRGITVQAAAYATIENPGTYYIVADVIVLDEGHNRREAKPTYLVNVVYPTIAADINIREKLPYYFSEKKTISFATLEFDEPNEYSYRILNSSNKVVQSGNSSYIILDTLFADLQNVGQTFTIQGLYRGKAFYYLAHGSNKQQLSEWKVMLDAPSAAALGDWAYNADKDHPLAISVDNPAAKRILYTMNAITPSGAVIFVKPEFRNLQITSNPDGLITNINTVAGGVFEYITFDYDKTIVDSMDKCSYKQVTITVEFNTQFNKHEKFVYTGFLLK